MSQQKVTSKLVNSTLADSELGFPFRILGTCPGYLYQPTALKSGVI